MSAFPEFTREQKDAMLSLLSVEGGYFTLEDILAGLHPNLGCLYSLAGTHGPKWWENVNIDYLKRELEEEVAAEITPEGLSMTSLPTKDDAVDPEPVPHPFDRLSMEREDWDALLRLGGTDWGAKLIDALCESSAASDILVAAMNHIEDYSPAWWRNIRNAVVLYRSDVSVPDVAQEPSHPSNLGPGGLIIIKDEAPSRYWPELTPEQEEHLALARHASPTQWKLTVAELWLTPKECLCEPEDLAIYPLRETHGIDWLRSLDD